VPSVRQDYRIFRMNKMNPANPANHVILSQCFKCQALDRITGFSG
jgi:hypothetical protein